MTDKPDDPRKPRQPGTSTTPSPAGVDSYPPPQFAPAAPSDSYPPPQFAPAAPSDSYPPPQFAPAAPSDSYPPPQFAPAAPSDSYPPPQFAPAAPSDSYPPPQFAPAAPSDSQPPPQVAPAEPSGSYPAVPLAPSAHSGSQPPLELGPPSASAPPSNDTSLEVRGAVPVGELAAPPEISSRVVLEDSGAITGPAPLAAASTSAPTAAAASHRPSQVVDEPLLPAEYNENDLRAAIGSPPMPEHIRPKRTPPPELDDRGDDDDGDGPRPRRRKAMLVLSASAFVGVSIAVLVILGRLSSARYVIGCEAKQVVAEQGRSFPPWGTSRMEGDEWKPIKIPPNFQCVGTETEDLAELGDSFRKMLVARADAMLTAREVIQIDDAAAMLEQGLLHARSDSDAHKSARQEIQRMLGDVGYWKASAKLREAATALTEAAKDFETAAAQLPRHVSDANAWAEYLRKLVDDLRAGPSGAKPAAFPPAPPMASTERSTAPPGVALPVEPTAGSGAGSATEPPPPPPDAGVPTGGVLL